MADLLPSDLSVALEAAASRLGPFTRIEHHADVGSTNDLALARIAAGAPHGQVILADAQRAGRGRRGRDWFSPPEAGLYLSAVLRSPNWGRALSLVTLAAGVAVARGLAAATGLVVELKWPNDIVVGRPWRKLAGILCESASAAPSVEAVVVGIGVNLRASAFPMEIAHRATSVETELGRPVDRAACAVETLAALAGVTEWLAVDNGARVVTEWRRLGAAGLGGAPVRWNDERGAHRGVARDLDGAGALLVQEGAALHRLVAGEVFWERLNRD